MFTDHVQKQTHDHSSGNESEVSLSTLNTFFFLFSGRSPSGICNGRLHVRLHALRRDLDLAHVRMHRKEMKKFQG